MPIANCLVTKKRYQEAKSSDSLIELWASESGKSSKHMTVNIIKSSEQQGTHPIVRGTKSLGGDRRLQ